MVITDESKMGTQLDLFTKVSLRGYSDLLRKKARPKWTLAKSNGKSIIRVNQTIMPLEIDDVVPIPYRLGGTCPLSLHLRSVVRKKSIRKVGEQYEEYTRTGKI